MLEILDLTRALKATSPPVLCGHDSVYTRHCVYYVSRMKPTAICPDHRPDIASECDELDAASLFRRTKNQKRKFEYEWKND